MIRNLTPHPVTFVDATGDVIATLPSEGVARAKVTMTEIGTVRLNGAYTVPLVESVYGEPENLPDPEDDVQLIVSLMTAQSARAAGRTTGDLFLTQDLARDDEGRVVGARSLSRL